MGLNKLQKLEDALFGQILTAPDKANWAVQADIFLQI